jgi:hypothetical protein
MATNKKSNRKPKWYLLPVIAVFIAISALSIGIAGTAFSREDLSTTDAPKVPRIEPIESSTSSGSYSMGLPVRCNVIIDK